MTKEERASKKRIYYLANREKLKAKRDRDKNKEERREYSRKYYLANKEKISNDRKKYNLKNAEKQKERKEKYRLDNKEKIYEYQKAYKLRDKELNPEKYENYRIVFNEKARLKRRTKEGLLSATYYQQKSRSKKRWGIDSMNYDKTYLINRFFDDPIYTQLYNTWRDANFKKELKPSIDRIDPNLPYTKNNIQILTWGENREKGYNEQNNKFGSGHRGVSYMDNGCNKKWRVIILRKYYGNYETEDEAIAVAKQVYKDLDIDL